MFGLLVSAVQYIAHRTGWDLHPVPHLVEIEYN